jgi:hypothetical protein
VVLVVAARLYLGHWPSYGDPDPKDLPTAFEPLYGLVWGGFGVLLALASAVLPIGVIVLAVLAIRGGSRQYVPVLALGLAPWVVVVWFFLADPGGFIEWLAD